MTEKILCLLLSAAAVLGFVALLVAFAVTDGPDRMSLFLEVGQGGIQLIVIVAVGGALKWIVDLHQTKQQEAEKVKWNEQERIDRALAEKKADLEKEADRRRERDALNQRFRQDKYNRLVAATNELRRLPLIINPDDTTTTRNAQKLAVFEVGLALRVIKHEIYSSHVLDDPPFSEPKRIAQLFELMYDFTDSVQQSVGNIGQPGECVTRSANGIGAPSEELVDFGALLRDPGEQELESCREIVTKYIDQKLTETAPSTEKPVPSWTTYLVAEGVALELITSATLMGPG